MINKIYAIDFFPVKLVITLHASNEETSIQLGHYFTFKRYSISTIDFGKPTFNEYTP